MPCVSFEDRLLDYGELSPAERETVDAHVARCEHCRQSLEAAAQLDAALAGLYSGARVAPALREAVLSRVSAQRPMTKPSFLPEVLDFIGWTGIIAAIVCLTTLLPQFRPDSGPLPP